MRFIVLFLIAALAISGPANAQEPHKMRSVASHVQKVAGNCPSAWDSAGCLEAVSESNMDLVIRYAEALDKARHKDSLEPLKENCAAATVSKEKNIPAYAFKSAYTVCANTLYDLSEETGVKPEPSQYQILVGAVLCLSDDPRCANVESGMKSLR